MLKSKTTEKCYLILEVKLNIVQKIKICIRKNGNLQIRKICFFEKSKMLSETYACDNLILHDTRGPTLTGIMTVKA